MHRGCFCIACLAILCPSLPFRIAAKQAMATMLSSFSCDDNVVAIKGSIWVSVEALYLEEVS